MILSRIWSSSHTVYHGRDPVEPRTFPEWAGIAPVSPRRRLGLPRYLTSFPVHPGRDPVEPRTFPELAGIAPVYPGIWHPSRFIPVHPGCIKHFKATGDMSRFNTVHPGSPRFSTVPPRFYPGSSRFIPDHRTGVNRGLKPALWERSFNVHYVLDNTIICKHNQCYLYLQDNTIVAFFSQRSGSVETFGSNDYISYEIECSDIADSGVDRTVSNLLGAT